MPVSLRLLDATAAGTQTLRLLTALVCSVSVTTAVAGPMAYRAIEFRHSSNDAVVIVADATRVPTQAVDRGVLEGGAQFAGIGATAISAAASTAATAALTSVVTVASSAVAATTDTTSASSTSGPANPPDLPAAAVGPASPAATGVPPQPTFATPQDPSAGAVVGATDNAATVQGTTTTAGPAAPITSPAGNDALDEFNPRRACDDQAQELNVGNNNPVCTPTSRP